MRCRTSIRAGKLLYAVTLSCACDARFDPGACGPDLPCARRGEICEQGTFTCSPGQFDFTTVEPSAAPMFADKVIALHRGELCFPTSAKSGSSVPISIRPCLHSCIEALSLDSQFSFECRDGQCDAFLISWIVASSVPEGCPPDAFSSFNQDLCSSAMDRFQSDFWFEARTESGPTQGDLVIEVPYLTNNDASTIADSSFDDEVVAGLVHRYPQVDSRVLADAAIGISTQGAMPPVDCRSQECSCFRFGFGP